MFTGPAHQRKALSAAIRTRRTKFARRLETGRKHCPVCRQTKILSDFPLSPRTADGHHGWCKSCRADLVRAQRHALRPAIAIGLTDSGSATVSVTAALTVSLDESAASTTLLAVSAVPVARPRLAQGERFTFLLACCDGGYMVNDETLNWWVCHHKPSCRKPWQPNLGNSGKIYAAADGREVRVPHRRRGEA
jgi:hypothetical protein